jgi:hypothetical protein
VLHIQCKTKLPFPTWHFYQFLGVAMMHLQQQENKSLTKGIYVFIAHYVLIKHEKYHVSCFVFTCSDTSKKMEVINDA